MAAPLILSRSPTCLSCLRRLASPIASSSSSSSSGRWGPLTAATHAQVQVRGKKKSARRQDQVGIVVRLLEDIPKFGRKDAIFPVERGRMRNQWFPGGKAEYMTEARFRELGLTRDDVGERDNLFGSSAPVPDELEVVEETPAPGIEVHGLSPERAHALLSFLVPETLTFTRKPIHATATSPEQQQQRQQPEQPRSPLLASNATVSTTTPSAPAQPDSPAAASPDPAAAPSPLAIFGSVSLTDVVAAVRNLLITDPEASRIVLGPEHVRFVGLGEGVDRVKSLGRWEVEIYLAAVGAAGRDSGVEPVRKVVEVLAGE
ncbi:putative fructose-bisphosphate aldolase [Phialemonium atrogriseum]|uniref:Fructose-bisphosphate aldolase n=1 Tax=Phialemonium atrogriseum TaxID=1093897 RepID=A0AAJ0FQT5_9PEZI|nr:putative fructose-bisphosphate aldolase [Phialemonium atrogriseum]KAK1769485.1 putative fructose-bisphosphate aldolase [Phialemonium atrogriseum]